ncbi:MAG: ZIP family metal transporter [Elusimicrobiota bacterium]
MVLAQILLATLCVGMVSFVGVFFMASNLDSKKLTFYLISLASGTMLGSAFLHLIPEALSVDSHFSLILIAVGIFFFFMLEKFLIWRHCHTHEHLPSENKPTTASLVVITDAIHNFIDGAIIASSFLVSPAIGWSTTTAIIMHEIPQEIGDFGVLLHSGYSKKKALLVNGLSASVALLGAVVTFVFVGISPVIQSQFIAITAGGFLYIALADLIPQLHERTKIKETILQIILLALGFLIMFLFAHKG